MAFIKLELSDDVTWTELLPDGNYTKTTDGNVYFSPLHIPYFLIDDKSISIWVTATGMGSNGLTTDHFELSFSEDGMGEYHRIKKELLES